jgi:hypothetical protein
MRFKGRAIAVGVAGFLVGGALTGVTVWAAGSRTAATGKAVERVAVVRSSQIFNTTVTRYTTIPGATVRITVPSGERALLIARFTTQEDCNVGDGNPSGKCMARIISNTREMAPASGGSAIDTVAAGNPAGVRSAALDRSLGPVGPGTYRIKVQVKVTNALMIVELTDWHLTVERVRV